MNNVCTAFIDFPMVTGALMDGPHWNQNLFNSELMTKSQVCVAAPGRECFFTRVQYMLTPNLPPFVSTSFPLDYARALSVMFTNPIMAALSWLVPWV